MAPPPPLAAGAVQEPTRTQLKQPKGTDREPLLLSCVHPPRCDHDELAIVGAASASQVCERTPGP